MSPHRRSKGTNIILALLATYAVGFVGWVAHQLVGEVGSAMFASVPPEKRFMAAWHEDVRRMDAAHSLPAGFKDLKSVEYIPTTDRLKTMLKKYPMDFKTTPQGHYSLEIFLDELKGGGLVMQYDLVELKRGNTIWERGRTFPQKL